MQGREKTNKIKKANEPFVSLLICFSTEIYQGGTVLALLALVQKYFMRATEKSDGIKKDSFVQFNVFEKYELNFSITSTATY